jgi:hypothetical protein
MMCLIYPRELLLRKQARVFTNQLDFLRRLGHVGYDDNEIRKCCFGVVFSRGYCGTHDAAERNLFREDRLKGPFLALA